VVQGDTDDFFLVLDGRLEVRLRDRTPNTGDAKTAAPRQEL